MNLRTHLSKQGTLFLAGRSDSNNEELISQTNPKEEVFHTAAPGSPFVNIKGEAQYGDIKEAAILCARYSREFKKKQGDVLIHRFLAKDIKKTKFMKTGTFGVKNVKVIKVKKDDIINFEANPPKKGQLKELLEKSK